jgi:WhiB family transcriptional regulator, redox-sensing transcriptional regulator
MTYAGGGLMTLPIRGEVGEVLPCRQGNADLFFAEAPADVEAAKALCRDCPIQEACLAGALERREPWGVWGGQLFIGGVVVARKRPRGRPRKYPLPEPFAPAAGSGGSEAAA